MPNTHAHIIIPKFPFEIPVWIRLPASRKRCPYTGLSRTTLMELCTPCAENDFRPPVVSKVLAKRGAIRGIRLLHYASLMSHLDSLPSDADGKSIPENPEDSVS